MVLDPAVGLGITTTPLGCGGMVLHLRLLRVVMSRLERFRLLLTEFSLWTVLGDRLVLNLILRRLLIVRSTRILRLNKAIPVLLILI